MHESILSSELLDSSDSDEDSEEESEEGQQINTTKQWSSSSLDLLVAARNQLIATIDHECKLVVKTAKKQCLLMSTSRIIFNLLFRTYWNPFYFSN